MAKTKIYYHATPYENLGSILVNGIKAGIDGVVYLTEKEEDAIKFLYVRGCRNFVTFKIKVRDTSKVIETFDHSEEFFKCKCYGYIGDISTDDIEPSHKWQL